MKKIIFFLITFITLFGDAYAFKYAKDKWIYFIKQPQGYQKRGDKKDIFIPTNKIQVKFYDSFYKHSIALKYHLKEIKQFSKNVFLFYSNNAMQDAQDLSIEERIEYARVIFKSKKSLK